MAFLALRFQPKMALSAIVALLHDLLVTAQMQVGFDTRLPCLKALFVQAAGVLTVQGL